MRYYNKGMSSLEQVVRESDIHNDSLINLVKKLLSLNTLKALISSIRICCRLISFIPPKYHPEIVKLINDSANHKSPIIRRELAASLRDLVTEGGPQESIASSTLKKLVKDPFDTVRVVAVESFCSRVYSKTYFMSNAFPIIVSSLDQKSWRMRYVLAKQMPEILASTDPKSRRQITAHYFRFMGDPETEVIIKAVEVLRNLSNLLDSDEIIEKLFPELEKKLLNHENLDVRIAVAGAVPYIATQLVKNPEQLGYLRTLIQQILKDESADVRIRLFLNLEPFLKALSSQSAVASFGAMLHDLLNDKNWKVRLDGLKTIESLVTKFPEEFSNDEKILKALNDKLADRIANVRKVGIITIRNLCRSLGQSWADRHGVTVFNSYASNPIYLYRINFPLGIQEISRLISPAVLNKQIDVLMKLIKDPVPNIRYQTLSTFVRLAQNHEDKAIEDRLKKICEELNSDSDMEVQKLASKVLATKDLKTVIEKFQELTI